MKVAGRVQDYLGRGDKREGTVTRMLESTSAEVPSGAYLSLGIAAMGASLLLLIAGRKNVANFVGQWVPTILIIGLYNKLVKLHGSD